MSAITYSASLIPGSNAYVGTVWIDGREHRCQHRHAGGFASAKACADLRAIVERSRRA